MPSPSEIRASALATLEAFVLRARRVRKHSLAADAEVLAKMCNPSWQITVNQASGTSTVTVSLPPEEAVESLAARVRPLFLQGDPVHHGKVLNALGFLLKDEQATEAMNYVKWLRGEWRKIDSSSDEMRAYRVEKGPVDQSAPPSVISDNSLAFAWFYGDVVHADATRRETSAKFDVTDRFEAAVPVVAKAAWLAHATLDLIEKLRGEGHLLQISDPAFDEAVAVEVTQITHEATVYVAPPGTAAPESIHHDFSDGWTRLTDVSICEDEEP